MAAGLQIDAMLNIVTSHARAVKKFQRVNGHEPKSAPGNGLHCATWLDTIEAIELSGADQVSVVVVFTVQLYSNFVQKPEDGIDPGLVNALDALMSAYVGDFELGGKARNLDIFGSSGFKFQARAGYVDIDGKKYRTIEITLPYLVNDAWAEVA